MRIRGYIWCLGINAVRQQVRAVMWIGDSNDAVRAPNANDNPFDDISSSKDFFGVYPLLTSSVVEEQLMPITGAMVDVKSSRKLEELNQVLLVDIGAKSTAGVSNVTVAYDLSVLIALP